VGKFGWPGKGEALRGIVRGDLGSVRVIGYPERGYPETI